MAGFFYLYCIKDKTAKQFCLMKGMDDKRVYTIPYEEIEAVVTEVSPTAFSVKDIEVKMGDIKWVEEKIRNHEFVIEEAMKEGGTTIPLKFLTLYKTEENLIGVLEEHYQKFQELLEQLKNKAEWGLKIYVANEKKLIEAIKKDDAEIKKLNDKMASAPPGVKYFLAKALNGKISKKIDERMEKYAEEIFKIFYSFSAQEPVPNRFWDGDRKKILSNSYLIPREKTEKFKRMADEVSKNYSSKGIVLGCTGPWPPYNFATLSI